MRLVRIEFEAYRRLGELSLDWHPITVLFGPNDSGKTSLLDAIDLLFRGLSGDYSEQAVGLGAVVELDAMADEDGIDQLVWGQVGEMGLVWLSPSTEFAIAVDRGEAVPGDVEGAAVEQLELPCTWSEVTDDLDAVVSLAIQGLAKLTDDRVVQQAAAECIRWLLRSRTFRFRARGGWAWIPDQHLLGRTILEAADVVFDRLPAVERRLREAEAEVLSLDPAELDPRVAAPSDQIEAVLRRLDGVDLPPANWVRLAKKGMSAVRSTHLESEMICSDDWNDSTLALWRVVRVADADTGRAEAERRVAEVINGLVVGWLVPGETDPCLEEGDEGWVRVHPAVAEVCAATEMLANQIAPEFITRDYEIAVAPVPPSRWGDAGLDARISIRLHLKTGDATALRVTEVGAGIGIWTSYVVLEALRQVSVLLEEKWASRSALGPGELFERWHGYEYRENRSPEEDAFYDRLVAYPPVPVAAQHTIYLFDEPERHLHPHARRRPATGLPAWLAIRTAQWLSPPTRSNSSICQPRRSSTSASRPTRTVAHSSRR